ncbi:hypothetical protein POSPLADRAFT_1147567 [Postia placenta MAD-698-R-SB12]|uniref:Aminopeptidase P N-terminal domain-containing protein n=1 Tax=Postia placenta MAD-698-R-SB12 TaxID=670580 RepID=A0A1X6MW55_9APHY|nr:hypothetical protein POSPLADRAFT_1147567 [Postia placenta MAD-698-R-SB12]OSX60604.1 hypothetical protein POSPLADRAFT_1147567 [Postia placenta MAD-698-R-SB12]
MKPSVYGQPLFPSHPHLVNEGELTPGIPMEEYQRRRRTLMDSLPPNSAVVCVAAPVKYMSGRNYKFRQASDFMYLTGFMEPSSAIVLRSNASSRHGYTYTFFHPLQTPTQALWDGARTSSEDVQTTFSADNVRAVDEFPGALKDLLRDINTDFVYIDLPPGQNGGARRVVTVDDICQHLSSSGNSDSLLDALNSSSAGAKRRPLAPEVGRLRSIKSDTEQRVMRHAADISGRAHAKTMRFTRPGISEHVLAAHFEYLCAREGSQRPAYVPVVASGPNALTIHYTANDQVIRADELILVDAGCEYNGYASDITRTWPATGRFTSAQAALYSAILSAQKALVTMCTARSGLSLSDIHRRSVELLRKELISIGFQGLSEGRMSELYPHFIGHPVGIGECANAAVINVSIDSVTDLHESTHFERNSPLKPGMVITIEPGIYVPPLPHYPKHFHNIGIRIEDEALVGEDYPDVLSVNAPKEIADVEGACQGLLGLEPF